MTLKIGVKGIWTVQHIDADGNPIGKPQESKNHWTRRGCIEMVERVHSSNVAIDPFGGRTETLFLGALTPQFALVAKAGFTAYNREDRLGWYRSVGDGIRLKNMSWFLVGGTTNWNKFSHLFTSPSGGGDRSIPQVNSRIHRRKANTDAHEEDVNDITNNLADKQTSYRFTAARRTLAAYNASIGPSIWHNHGSISPGATPVPTLGRIWVPLALGLWPVNHEIDGNVEDAVDIFYTIEFSLSFP